MLRKRIATPKNNYDEIISVTTSLINSVKTKLNQKCSIGICTPGSLSPATALLRNSNTTCMNGKSFKKDLEQSLGNEIRISNDANCFALSEATDGAGRDSDVIFGVIVGTGVGGGIVVNKKVLSGTNRIAGEWGHNPLPWPEADELKLTQCWCGQQGCIETFLSGPGLESDFMRETQNKLNVEEIVALALQGGTSAESVLVRYEHRMARSLAHVVNLLDPDVIVLGGGISNLARLYMNVPKIWHQWIFSDCVRTKLLPPKYGDSSGVRGAAWLWE